MAVETSYITHSQWRSHSATELTYPNSRQVGSGYDALYRRNSITDASGSTNIAAWQFFGQRTATVTLGNGIVTSYMNNAQTRSAIQYGQTTPGWGSITTDQLGYDGAGRLIGKRHFNGSTVLVGNTTAYDPSSNKLFERALHAESRSFLYDSYDSMDRLLDYQRGILASGGGSITTSISLPGTNQEQAYNLDALGNWSTTTITPEGGTPAVQSRTHNKVNEVTHYGVSPVYTPVLYDHGNNTAPHANRGNGNIANDGVRLYHYDALNRLVQVNNAASPSITWAAYTYDVLGRRIRKVVTNGGLPGDPALNATIDYLYDRQQIIEDRDSSNSAITQYVWGQYIDELVQLTTYVSSGSQPLAAGTRYLLSDLLYRSVALTSTPTSGTASIVEAYDTDAYGNTLIYSGPGADSTWFTDDDLTSTQPACDSIFTGRQFDAETLIYYYRSRYYQPQLGRFLGRDPIGYQGGLNLYEYVKGRPIFYLDPIGFEPNQCCEDGRNEQQKDEDEEKHHKWMENILKLMDEIKKLAAELKIAPEAEKKTIEAALKEAEEQLKDYATDLGMSGVEAMVDGLSKFGDSKDCGNWYKDTMEKLQDANDGKHVQCDQITSAPRYQNCLSDLQGTGMINAASWFESLATKAQDACTGCESRSR